jgi:hypothetical protein
MEDPELIDPIIVGKEKAEIKDIKMRRRVEYYKRRVKPDFAP